MADVELLPLPEPGMLHVGEPREWFTADQMRDYARANVLRHTATPQQPAAVDEAMAERFCRRWYEITGRSLERAHVLASLDAALMRDQEDV